MFKPVKTRKIHYSQLQKRYKEAIANASDCLEFNDYDFSVRIETYRTSDIRHLIEKVWSWNCSIENLRADDKKRVENIIAKQQEQGIWPYVSYWADDIDELCETTIEKWMKNGEMQTEISVPNHGDGWHRVIAAVEQGRKTVEILFLEP